jgi:uncharacterized membrane protein
MQQTGYLRVPANVGEPEQWLSVLGGLALGGYGLTRGVRWSRGMQAGLLTIGGLLLARGMIGHCMLYQALGLNSRGETPRDDVGGQAATRLEHAVTVHRPVNDVYRFWRHVENWPLIMPHLKSVTVAGQNRFHWSLKGPAGATVMWDAVITDDRPNELIAWESMTRSGGTNRGLVRFRTIASGETEVRMRLDYNPAAGPVGVATERLLGDDPEHRIHEQLEQFKRLMEPGAGAS